MHDVTSQRWAATYLFNEVNNSKRQRVTKLLVPRYRCTADLSTYICTWIWPKKVKRNRKRLLKYQRPLFMYCLSPTLCLIEWQISTFSTGFFNNLNTTRLGRISMWVSKCLHAVFIFFDNIFKHSWIHHKLVHESKTFFSLGFLTYSKKAIKIWKKIPTGIVNEIFVLLTK